MRFVELPSLVIDDLRPLLNLYNTVEKVEKIKVL